MALGKWTKRILWTVSGLMLSGMLGVITLFLMFSPPRAYVKVENQSDELVKIISLSYAGNTLDQDITIGSGTTSKRYCMWPSRSAEIVIEFIKQGTTSKTIKSFSVTQKLYQQRDFVLVIKNNSIGKKNISFEEGVDHSDCVFVN